jgi:hypothetical protein
MVLITRVTGAYKPTNNWGASHCMGPTGTFQVVKHQFFMFEDHYSDVIGMTNWGYRATTKWIKMDGL